MSLLALLWLYPTLYKEKKNLSMKYVILFIFLALLCNRDFSSSFMADPLRMPSHPVRKPAVDPNAAAVHIIYTEKPQENEEPESYHIRTLTSVLGSEEAAREALIYSYKNAASGFSAKLTPEQVAQISAQPGVLQVVPSMTYQLHSGPGAV
ncbi:unnamed protein product [Rhodiola kirilowii]